MTPSHRFGLFPGKFLSALSNHAAHAGRRVPFILWLAAASLVPVAAPAGKAPPTPDAGRRADVSPRELCAQLRKSLAKVRRSCVSVYSEGYGSGVVISPDGLVLTAAHMMRKVKDDQHIRIEFEDGGKVNARLLGLNRESDIALLKIEDAPEKRWPHCELAGKATLTGGFCFTFAHPAGLTKGRPAQVRLGRITTHSTRAGKACRLLSDCNIQPGDSGGPLFSMDGKLIGIDSSAGKILGFNVFAAIDQYHADRKRLLKGERWGDPEKAPDGAEFKRVSMTAEKVAKVEKEFLRRIKIGYPPTIDLLRTLKNVDGSVELSQKELLGHMPGVVIAIDRDQPLSLGLDDPRLVKQLTTLSADAGRGIPLYCGASVFGYGTAIDARHIVTKASLLPKKKNIFLMGSGKHPIPLRRAGSDATWDLALLEVGNPVKLPVVKWPPPKTPSVEAGDLLQTKDSANRTIWNVATDKARAVPENPTVGPIKDKSLVSKRRAPYPLGIRHALPLFARDAGMPVFNERGEFVGMHIARLCRTLGLIVPAEPLRRRCSEMLARSAESAKRGQPADAP